MEQLRKWGAGIWFSRRLISVEPAADTKPVLRLAL